MYIHMALMYKSLVSPEISPRSPTKEPYILCKRTPYPLQKSPAFIYACGHRWFPHDVCCSVFQRVPVCCSVVQCCAVYCTLTDTVLTGGSHTTLRISKRPRANSTKTRVRRATSFSSPTTEVRARGSG